MRVTYVDSAITSTTPATALDALAGADEDRILYKIIVGKPVAAATITVFNMSNALANNTTNIAFKYTFPTFGAGTPASDQIIFSTGGGRDVRRDGLNLPQGGSVATSSAMQVSFLWDNPDA